MTVWLRTISGTIKEWFTVSVYGMVGKDEVVFSKEVYLKSALNIPEGKVTEIDVELIQGYTVNAYLDNQVIGESSISGTMCYEISGREWVYSRHFDACGPSSRASARRSGARSQKSKNERCSYSK